MIRIGINGYNRVGQLVLRAALEHPEMHVVAINDPGIEPDYIAYLTKYDSTHGQLGRTVDLQDGHLVIDGKAIKLLSVKDAAKIPWTAVGAEYVVDGTLRGKVVKGKNLANAHLEGGARMVILASPASDVPMFVLGVNHEDYHTDDVIVSNASCSTNCLGPVVKVIHDKFGIVEGVSTSVHGVSSSSMAEDGIDTQSWRMGRGVLSNIIPHTTSAGYCIGKIIPRLEGKLAAAAVRIPTATVSAIDLACKLENSATMEDIRAAMKKASQTTMKGILGYTDDHVVSQDFLSDKRSSIFDANASFAVNDKFVRILSWYDNEAGYCHRVVDLIRFIHHKTQDTTDTVLTSETAMRPVQRANVNGD